MTPNDLIAAFETLAEAPDGVTRLRELVLQLAVRGRLVPQDPNDEPARESLARNAAELAKLVAAKKIRRPKTGKPTLPVELSFALPRGWMPGRFPDVATWAIGSGFPKKYQGHSNLPFGFCKVSDMNRAGNEREILTTANTIDEGLRTQMRAKLHASGTVIFPKIGGAIATNKRRLLVGPTAIDNNCLGLTPFSGTCPDWLFLLLSSIDLAKYQSGTSVPALSQGTLETISFGVPPLAEQKRIVAKVDELMGLLDRLEAARDSREKTRAAARDAALAALRDADTAEDVEVAWTRVAERMDDLFTEPADVEPLRQTVLQLAVRGRLVPQDPNDEPASALLERIAAEKTKLVAAKKVRRPQLAPPIAPTEVPFDVPASWEWCRLQNLVDPLRGISYGIIKLGPEPSHGGVPTLRCSDVRFRRIVASGIRTVEPAISAEYQRTVLRGGELLVNIRGTLGGCAIVPPGMDGYNIAREVAVVPLANAASANYALEVFASPLFQDFTSDSLRGIAYRGLNLGLLRDFLVPLPPGAEQARIVAKVDELMGLLDRLEARLTKQQDRHRAFALSAVRHFDVDVASSPAPNPPASTGAGAREPRTPKKTSSAPDSTADPDPAPKPAPKPKKRYQPAQPSLGLVEEAEVGFLDMDRESQVQAVHDALFGLGALAKDAGIRAAGDGLRTAGLVKYGRLRRDGKLYARIDKTITAGVRGGLFDRPKRGLVRAVKTSSRDYTPQDWEAALLGALEDVMTKDELVRAAAEWAAEAMGLQYKRLRGGGVIDEGLRKAMARLKRRGRLVSAGRGLITQSPEGS